MNFRCGAIGAMPAFGAIRIELGVISVVALLVATVGTMGLGAFGVRRASTTSDFFVASRSVGVGRNASAICGEYLSAASFLGIAGLIMRFGADMLWYPISYTAGYLLLLFFVAAPLRRFGAYTVPDFAEGRLQSVVARRIASSLVVLISTAYLIPQMRGAGVTFRVLTGAPYWSGVAIVALVVTTNVAMGGMRGITFVQAFQYWVKWVAIAIPAIVIAIRFFGSTHHWPTATVDTASWATPITSASSLPGKPGYTLPSFVLAQMLGTIGLPHILVRFYTNPDGKSARRTTILVIALLSAFYVFPPVLGAFGRYYAPDLLRSGSTDTIVLLLPRRVFGGLAGDALTGLVACGAFAAFMSTASGLMICAAGAISQDVLHGEKRDFRIGAVTVGIAMALFGFRVVSVDINQLVSWAFAIAASSFAPLVVLGIWWRGLTARGAIAGMLAGALSATAAVSFTLFGPSLDTNGWASTILAQPAIWTIPIGFVSMITISKLTRSSAPSDVAGMMLNMHLPEALGLARDFRA
jgi:cation/acetate symporter